MPLTKIPLVAGTQQQSLFIFLPGLGDQPQDFIDQGFVELVQQKNAVDVWIADAHFAYYANGSILERLGDDVYSSSQIGAYKNVYLLGVSMGGAGSLLSVRDYGQRFKKVIVIAPFLGDGDLIAELSQTGAKAWRYRPDANRGVRDEQFRLLWKFLQKDQVDRAENATGPTLYLAYGLQDRGSTAHKLLADILPTKHVFTMPGTHNWKTWLSLFEVILEELSFE